MEADRMNVNSVDAVAGVANPDTEQFADRIPIQHSDLGFVKIQDRFDYRVSGRSAAKTRCSALEMLYLFGRCGCAERHRREPYVPKTTPLRIPLHLGPTLYDFQQKQRS
jgi:hypothetical protein